MKKVKDIEDVKKRLESATVWWVCPITGVQIDANNLSAIENHKKELLEKEEKKINSQQVQKAINKLRKEYYKINSIDDLNQWFEALVGIKIPNVKKEDIPLIVLKEEDFTTGFDNLNPYKVIGGLRLIPKNSADTKFKITKKALLDLITIDYEPITKDMALKDKTKGVMFQILYRSNPLSHNIESYVNYLKSNKSKKVGIMEKGVLSKNKEYVQLVKEQQKLNEILHENKKKHGEVRKEMEKLRSKLLGSPSFDDFVLNKKDLTKLKI